MTQAESPYAADFRGQAVLITGGAGFIGSHLAHRLVELGAAVRVIDDLSSGHRENLPKEKLSLHEASILDDDVLRDAVAGCRYVFHLAAMVSVPQSVAEPMRCAQVNITGTERVLEAARDAGVQRFVLASSAAVYGDEPSLPSRETDPIDCCSPYAASKAAGEGLVSAFGRCYEMSTVSLRFFNVFGPRQDPKSPYAAAIAAFVDAFAAGRRPTIFGDGLQTRDFIHIDNIVHGVLLAATCARDLRGAVMNLGCAAQVSLLDVIDVLNEATGQRLEPVFAEPRPGDVRHSAANIDCAREVLGFEPLVGFAEGLGGMIVVG